MSRHLTASDHSTTKQKAANLNRRLRESYEHVRDLALLIVEEFNNDSRNHAIPIWPLSDEDSVVTTVATAIRRQKEITQPPPISSPEILIPNPFNDKD